MCTTLLNPDNLSYMTSDEELVHPATPPPPPQSYLGASSSSRPSSSQDYPDIHATLRSIQEEQVSLQAHVQFQHVALCDFVQERYDEFRGMIASQNQYFQYFSDCLDTWRDCHISQPHCHFPPFWLCFPFLDDYMCLY